jgi:peptide/nickel transport system permease protein
MMRQASTLSGSDISSRTQPQRASNSSLDVVKRFAGNRVAVLGLFVILILLVCAIFAPQIAPYGYDDQNLAKQFLSPSLEHLFGTDDFGRDVFSRVVYGSRISLAIGITSVAFASVIGVLLGCVAGYFNTFVDNCIMRVMDVLMSIPSILLAISIVSMLGMGFKNMIIAIGCSSIPAYTRVVRGLVLSIKNKEYIEAAISNGAGSWQIIFTHVIPNCVSAIIVRVTTNIAGAILYASSLSFIGLGIAAPAAEWGAMLSAGRAFFRIHWYVVTFPGLAIMISVLAFNLFGDGLRDAFDPKMK